MIKIGNSFPFEIPKCHQYERGEPELHILNLGITFIERSDADHLSFAATFNSNSVWYIHLLNSEPLKPNHIKSDVEL